MTEKAASTKSEKETDGVSIGDVSGGIHGSIIAGRDVIGNIIAGDYAQVFVGSYERLQEVVIQPQQVFERVDLQRFVGREWILAEIDAFLRNHDRGYFLLEAAAGLGKTTLLAWLVKHNAYIHHFCELAKGLEIDAGLKNLAAQLLLAYELSDDKMPGLLSHAATRTDYLFALLDQAAKQRQSGEKIVLVVDALDEAEMSFDRNVLGLPSILPEGVYFIVSQRPVPVTLRVETPHTPCYRFRLTANSEDNLADMRRFLEQAATWPGIECALLANGYTANRFTEILLEKCAGVWIYLHYAVYEIAWRHFFSVEQSQPSELSEGRLSNQLRWRFQAYGRSLSPQAQVTVVKADRQWMIDHDSQRYFILSNQGALTVYQPGERSPLDLEMLPQGMAQYYAHYWQRWRNADEDRWYEVCLPILSTLAASQEAISLEYLQSGLMSK